MTIDRIVILDFGSQTTHLIGRRIRERGVFAEIVVGTTPVSEWFDPTVKGVILSGSPYSVHDAESPRPDPRVYDLDVPVLGICFRPAGNHPSSRRGGEPIGDT
jgi:GMP synthase (glutamine-hydrolysing)